MNWCKINLNNRSIKFTNCFFCIWYYMRTGRYLYHEKRLNAIATQI